MSTRDDQLLTRRSPDRLFYATGMLLDQQDFEDEQTYHRNRLARALAYLHGSGTVAGLEVQWQPPADQNPGEIAITAGLAVDRLGRLIEVPRRACIRLKPWFDAQPPDDLNQALHNGFYHGLVVDLFIRFVACDRGKTPAFASGAFDATNAAAPSRVRDAYELKLFLRRETDVASPGVVPLQQRLPVNPWPDLSAIADANDKRAALRQAIFQAWRDEGESGAPIELPPLAEHVLGQDPGFLFLARLVVPAAATAADKPPDWDGQQVEVQNEHRLFLYTPNALGI